MCFVCALKRSSNATFVTFCDNIKIVRLMPQDIANKIIRMAAAGATQGAIAKRYGVHRHSVRNILRRHALWHHASSPDHRPAPAPAQERFIRTAHLSYEFIVLKTLPSSGKPSSRTGTPFFVRGCNASSVLCGVAAKPWWRLPAATTATDVFLIYLL